MPNCAFFLSSPNLRRITDPRRHPTAPTDSPLCFPLGRAQLARISLSFATSQHLRQRPVTSEQNIVVLDQNSPIFEFPGSVNHLGEKMKFDLPSFDWLGWVRDREATADRAALPNQIPPPAPRIVLNRPTFAETVARAMRLTGVLFTP
ncbi:unnamed protein product [Linum trigynum]|uniref:Uncharacterized protein n=1 Tax=Linum trigynum TaxID=586398 RepID=A0AAV2E5J0_9ROSI